MVRSVLGLPAGAALCCALMLGCSSGPAGPPPAPEPAVTVAYPLDQQITDYHEYTGRTAAVDSVNVQSQVTGYLQKINFKDGAEVNKGAVLYNIDPRPYQAALDQAQAQLKLQQANLTYNESVYQRDVSLGTAVSTEEMQKDLAARNTSQASVQAAKAAVEQADLNIRWTKVEAPITGRLSRTLITPGNLVVANQTVLTNIVSLDPMYVYFDVDEPTALEVQQLIREGKFKSYREGYKVPVFIGLATEQGFPHEGYLSFVNNQINPTTATLTLRGVFTNAKPSVGPRLLAPGMFVRVRLAVSPPYQALEVSVDVVGTDQTLKYVYIVNDQNKVERRSVQLGTQHGSLVVVTKGLKPNERVIINGIQQVRPGITVSPTLAPMTGSPGAAPHTPPAVSSMPGAAGR